MLRRASARPVKRNAASRIIFIITAPRRRFPKNKAHAVMKNWGTILFAALCCLWVAPASAQPSLSGKTVRVVIGSAVSGTYDLLGRLLARHIGQHLPGNPA